MFLGVGKWPRFSEAVTSFRADHGQSEPYSSLLLHIVARRKQAHIPKAFACPEHDVSVLPINRVLSAEEAESKLEISVRTFSPCGWRYKSASGLGTRG